MNRPSRVLVLLVVLGCTVAGIVAAVAEPTRAERWARVEEAVRKGLPKTAVQELDPIIASALKDKAYPEAIKAVGKKIVLEAGGDRIQPWTEKRIEGLKAAIPTLPAETHPVLHALLGHWYYRYFEQNKGRIAQRSSAGATTGPDVTTWDLPRVLAEADRQFELALSHEKELKATPIAAYTALLSPGTIPDAYRPTLFDVLAFDALDYYALAEQHSGPEAEDAFEFTADSPAFAPVDEFLKWRPTTTDTGSRVLKAIGLYQNLLAFHQADADKSAFLDADLYRLRFAYNTASGDTRTAAYLAALARFAETHKRHEVAAMARYRWAGVLKADEELAKAREVALAGAEAFPESPGGKLCRNVVREIEAKSSMLSTERVWGARPEIHLTYANLTKVYFRLLKADYESELKAGRAEGVEPEAKAALLKQKPTVEFAHGLAPTLDYRERLVTLPGPQALAPGFYYLFASHAADFGANDNVVTVTTLWVSDLAIVSRPTFGSPRVEGLVLDGTRGEPIPGAKVRLWERADDNGPWAAGPGGTTDRNGMNSLPGRAGHNSVVVATHRNQALSFSSLVFAPDEAPKAEEYSVLFTDRALYRPGQTIRFKGIAFRVDPSRDEYTTVANHNVLVEFTDVNRKEIARLQVRTNEYGSFSGSFAAPRDRLTGKMWLRVIGEPPGETSVSVEEYKRPKFTVSLDGPKGPVKLGADVRVPGKAIAYTGVPVGRAKVQYRVVREVRYPAWFFEYTRRRSNGWVESQEIAHGVTTTEADGTFSIPFPARPDPNIPEKDDPSFEYTVTADVTDATGETRTGTGVVEVGYSALRATVTAAEWQTADKEVKLTVSTTTLDGTGQSAKGVLRIHQLKEPTAVVRPGFYDDYEESPFPTVHRTEPKPTWPGSWAAGGVVRSVEFTTDAGGKAAVSVKLPAGVYRAVVESTDGFGKPVTGKTDVRVLDPAADRLTIKVPNVVSSPSWSVEPGAEFTLFWGTGYDAGRAFLEVEHRGKVIRSLWTELGKTQATLKVPVTEAMRGGLTVRVTFVHENRAYLTTRRVEVPWSNKELRVRWETFRSKLEPGKKETFTAVITGPDAKRAVAEMVAALYDQSLDAHLPHDWIRQLDVFRRDDPFDWTEFANTLHSFGPVHGDWATSGWDFPPSYRGLPDELIRDRHSPGIVGDIGEGIRRGSGGRLYGGGFAGGGRGPMGGFLGGSGFGGNPFGRSGFAGMAGGMMGMGGINGGGLGNPFPFSGVKTAPLPDPSGAPRATNDPRERRPDLNTITARKNLTETAFFFPHLVSDADGVVRMEFTMPEALTKWKFLGFAHDKELRSGFLTGEVVTAKDLMAQPNPPRFLREGDVIEFPVKVSNRSATRQTGTVRLTLRDARTDAPLDAALGITAPDQLFDLPAGESKTFAWRITVAEGVGPLAFKAVAASDRLSDGEEGVLPVLAKKVLVTESLALPIRNAGTRDFDFARLRQSAGSDTIRNQSYTVQMVSQPAWYAVMALPYLMEFPHECTEQSFNRLYANGLARHIATSDPKIRKVFDLWKGTSALDSPLEKNQDLKAVMLDETPWVRQAVKEGQARKNVGVLFDDTRLADETARLARKMAELQSADGMWPWFPGGRPNEYMTLYIATGYGRLRHLGVQVDTAPAVKATTRLDAWVDEKYRRILAHAKPDENHLSPTIALYLYGRSFFLPDRGVSNEHRPAVDYWLGQAKTYWPQLVSRQSQGHLALALKRFGDKDTPRAIMASIKERSVSNEELGMFWRDLELQQWWFHAPIETQALMIEAFDEVMNDAQAVEDCKVWLLKQKQTQDWKTTKATADAVYALLLRGEGLLKSGALVEVTLGNQKLVPEKVEAGTGFYEHRFLRSEVNPSLAAITLKKTDPGVSWGSVHWQYLEDVGKVTPADGGPLKVEKRLFKRSYTKAGPVIEPINGGELRVGDEVVVRVVLRTDRDLEYVHLKDHRGSGTEPVNVLSGYRFQDGLAYYESTKDTASHFFIDYLPKGNYVFEYPVRVQHRGRYPTGFARAQCVYAPEFNSHSETITLDVK